MVSPVMTSMSFVIFFAILPPFNNKDYVIIRIGK
jgi:hypothetical protein